MSFGEAFFILLAERGVVDGNGLAASLAKAWPRVFESFNRRKVAWFVIYT
jgi:hypothetical protein